MTDTNYEQEMWKELQETKTMAERLAGALEFYASEWRSDVYIGPSQDLLEDAGSKAREAVAEFEKFKDKIK